MVQTICCIGAGYVGGPSMAVMADRCPGLDITVVDLDQARIDAWNNLGHGPLPVYEPGLEAVLERVLGRNLQFSTDVNNGIRNADMVFLSVNTPTKRNGHGAGVAADITYIEKAARQIAEVAKGHTIVVERSTLPVRTADVLRRIFANAPAAGFEVLSNPEFMAEGTAISDLESPDRVLVGGHCNHAVDQLADIYANWVSPERIIRTNLWSSELAKLTANAFLAQRISSINSIAALCEKTGADVVEVRRAIGSDSRLGSHFLSPGPGFGGSCFKKDLLNLIYLADHYGLAPVANYWRSVLDMNTYAQQRLVRKIVRQLFGTLRDKTIAILGFAFKADTNDTRESPAIAICRELLAEGAHLAIHDPRVSPKDVHAALDSAVEAGSGHSSFRIEPQLVEVFRDADAAVVLTDWAEYRQLDWPLFAALMRRPAWVFDTRRGVDLLAARRCGLETWAIGAGEQD
ncbi:nucleotide sugar dehydrogenase [Vulcanococcus sp. Clear-D1]|jgi:UDPglucose 6-dehydrogenase|uniref:nucleotide sugar dehydrogenase n=1 Tax=Vulcanococcus sp. Clear-D1 TaxID=2766970 RepID=UPI0019B900FD|nr:nucleotide sugar dehydrogenase [Vulcanococcus sp. Clear-D1]MBD1194708.1 nucleotide sugar dehydrogenase [Vulcanococcus sp. Clear-D1]